MNDMSTSAPTSNTSNTLPNLHNNTQQNTPRPPNVHSLVVAVFLILSIVTIAVWIPNSDHTINSAFTIIYLVLGSDIGIFALLYSNARLDEKLDKKFKKWYPTLNIQNSSWQS